MQVGAAQRRDSSISGQHGSAVSFREEAYAMTSVLEERLAQATRDAQMAMLNLVGLMRAHGIPRSQLTLMIPEGWPAPVKVAFAELQPTLIKVALLLAFGEGIESWEQLPTDGKAAYLTRAYARVMDSSMPTAPHSSGVAPLVRE